MLTKGMVRFGGAALVVLAGGLVDAASAQHRGSPEDQLACTPDVYRLCSSYVPDEDAITSCLRRNIQVLSKACHDVMTRPDTPATGAGGGDDAD